MRHSQLRHFAGKGAASGNEAKRKASGSVPPDGGGAHEALREHRGAVGGVRYISTPARLVKKPVERPASCSKSKLLGRHALIQRSPGYVTADQNTSWHTTLSTPNGTIISHMPELSQNHADAPEPSIRLSRLSAKMRKHSIAASW